MMNGVKSEDFKYIEECFAHIKQGEDINENLNRIERALARIFDIKFELSIAKNEIHEFFAVNVFPTTATLDDIVSHMTDSLKFRLDRDEKYNDSTVICDRWAGAKEWLVEIDGDMICDRSTTYTPADITSAMLYEIIRIVYTQTVPMIVYKRFRSCVDDVSRMVKALFSNKKIAMLINLAIAECCQSKMFSKISEEADNTCTSMCTMLTSMGYLTDYNDLVDKFIGDGKTTDLVYRTYPDIERDIKVIFVWIITTIKELEFNKKRLRESIQSETLRASSDVVKNILRQIENEFFEGITEPYRVLLSEQWHEKPVDKYAEMATFENLIKSCAAIMKEAVGTVFDKNGKLKKISQLDIDVISVDVERIETHDDKIYVLDKIYDRLQIVEAGLDYIESGDPNRVVRQSKQTLLNMKKELEDLRRRTLATRIIDREYGVFIKYPKGYEG